MDYLQFITSYSQLTKRELLLNIAQMGIITENNLWQNGKIEYKEVTSVNYN